MSKEFKFKENKRKRKKGIEKALKLSYCLVDINDYTKEQLGKERSSIAKAMLMEKIKNREELIQELEKIAKIEEKELREIKKELKL